MFTVTLGFDGSGNSSTRSPLVKVYSVMPSTEAPFWTPAGGCENAEIARDTAMANSLMRMVPLCFWIIAAACYSGGHALARRRRTRRASVRSGGLAERARAQRTAAD